MSEIVNGAELFRAAAEAKDVDAALAALSAGVVLHSPITHRPVRKRSEIRFLLEALVEIFENFRYTDQLDGDGVTALVFRTTVGGREVEGLDLMRLDDDGLVEDLTVMLRPKSGMDAVLERVGRKLESAITS